MWTTFTSANAFSDAFLQLLLGEPLIRSGRHEGFQDSPSRSFHPKILLFASSNSQALSRTRRFRLDRFQKSDQLILRPCAICDSSSHRGRHLKRHVDASHVVPREVERHRSRMVLQFLGEAVCQAGESAHRHPHGEVLALHVAGVDVLRIGRASDSFLLAADALGWAGSSPRRHHFLLNAIF